MSVKDVGRIIIGGVTEIYHWSTAENVPINVSDHTYAKHQLV